MSDRATGRTGRLRGTDLAILVWLALYVPAYAQAYGGWHFLQLCNLGVLMACAGALLRRPLLWSSTALLSVPVGALWLADVVLRLCSGHFLHRGTAYLWNDTIPWPARLLSLYHVILPAILLVALRRRGYDPRAFAFLCIISGLACLLGLWAAPAADNLNYMQHWPGGRTLSATPLLHGAATWALLCVVLLWPMHRLCLLCFPRPLHDAP